MTSPGNIHPELLYIYTAIFIVVILVILLRTGILLRKRRKKYQIEQQVQSVFDEWLSHLLTEDFPHDDTFVTPPWLAPGRENKIARQYAINQLISTKKNLAGHAGRNIIWLYEKMGLKADSIAKFRSPLWYHKAAGIYELYMMEQRDMQAAIARHTNHHNAYVRMESQTAVLAFAGFDGLIFLDTLTRPMNDWQQLKLIDQLTPLDPGNLEHLSIWLNAGNPDVVLFALKLAGLYQQMHVLEDVITLLKDHREKLREQAIKTLVRVGDENTPSVLIQRYAEETPGNRNTILKSLASMATDKELPFLQTLLEDGDPGVQLQAARIMMKCCHNGEALVKVSSLEPGDTYDQLYLHIKSEMAR
ncbi:HEAT repeat domain-containing protein [uncultured Chitinophaga sp.]|uniref:HEAT repeat domain-containing protein n=1 Tax=uncultured Chitinophaga sp. TaxID=339340 RepID=UPI00262BE249|nr:HEAT repeat domain-containing protein [uncultured Chitinophaga sp.]